MTTTNNWVERRIQKTGGSSYTVTLPKQWVATQKLSEQDELKLFAHSSGTLCLKPAKSNTLLTQHISLESKTAAEVTRELIGAYLAGAEQIILTSYIMTPELRQIVRSNLFKLVNFETFDSTSTKIVLRYTGNTIISARDYINKASKLTISMLVDTLQAIEHNHRATAQDVIERDVDIDRINLVILRQFNQFLTNLIPTSENNSLTTLNYYRQVSIRLERIADHIARICTTFLQLKPKDSFTFSPTEIRLTKKLITSLELCATMIDELNKDKAHELINEYELTSKNAFINQKITHQNSINILIQDSLERVRSYIANIAEETIDYCNIEELTPHLSN